MSLQVSTGWKALTVALAKASFDGGVIRLFSGTQPATSDLAQTGALLGEIRIDGGAPLAGSFLMRFFAGSLPEPRPVAMRVCCVCFVRTIKNHRTEAVRGAGTRREVN